MKIADLKVFDFINFREYLRELFAAAKAQKAFFSHAYLAKLCGFGSTGYIKMVMDGNRNLSAKAVHKVAKAFELGKKETAYFEALVFFNQAKSEAERETFRERLMALRPKLTKQTALDKEKYDYFTKSHYVIIREMVAIPGFQEDAHWIAKQLSQPITPSEAQRALDTLMDLKLIKRDEQGKLVQQDTAIRTPKEVQAFEIFQYHAQMLDLAKESLANVSDQLRDVTALTIPITLETLPIIKEKIHELRDAIVEAVNQGDPNYDEVYQLNFQCFPVTHISDKIAGDS